MSDPTWTELASGESSAKATTVAFPAQPAGTLLVLTFAGDDYSATSGTGRPESTGWTQATVQRASGQFHGSSVWFKIAAGDTSVTYTIGSASKSVWKLVAADSINTTTPLDQAASAHNNSSAVPTPSTAATSSGRKVGFALHTAGRAAGAPGTHGSWGSGYTALGDVATTSGVGLRNAHAYLAFDGGAAASAPSGSWGAPAPEAASGHIVVFNVASESAPTPVTGTTSGSVPRATASLSGTVAAPSASGTVSGSVPRVTATVLGTATAPISTGTISATTPAVTGSLPGTYIAPTTGTASASLPVTTATLTGTASAPSGSGTVDATLPAATGSVAGTVTAPTYTGTLAGATPATTGSLSGTTTPPTYPGTITAAIPPTRSTIGGTVTTPAGAATLSANLPRVTGSIPGTVVAPTWAGTLGGTLPAIAGNVSGIAAGPAFTGSLEATLPRVTGSATGTATVPQGTGTLVATLPALAASLAGVVHVDDDLIPASARILAAVVRAPTASGDLRAPTATATLRTPTARGSLR